MKTIVRLTLWGLLAFLPFSATSQDVDHVAPSLQVGLSGITFSPGILDKDIAMQLIMRKQDEVKVRLIRNTLLNNLNLKKLASIDFSDEIYEFNPKKIHNSIKDLS